MTPRRAWTTVLASALMAASLTAGDALAAATSPAPAQTRSAPPAGAVARPEAAPARRSTPRARRPAAASPRAARPAAPATSAGAPASPDPATAREHTAGGPRTLEDIHIEGEIPVPQVLFITTRDQRRFVGFQHRRYQRTSRKIGEDTAMPSRVMVTGAATLPERSHSDE
jgi:hypothetical protein